MVYYDYYNSPLGILTIQATDCCLTGIYFENKVYPPSIPSLLTEKCIVQLKEYFQGQRTYFDLPFNFSGTEFQKKVWFELQNIPYGKTLNYKEIAKLICNPKASRAIGNANNKNQIPIIVPCHRVIASNGSLSGYGGEIWRKKWLLEFERRILINKNNMA